jgi:hypothetical protein
MPGFSQVVLNKAAANQRKVKESRKVGAKISETGVRTHRIDSRLFHQGVAYGRKHGVHQPWDEPNFVQEMEKCHPDIAVDGGSHNGSSPISPYMLEQAKKLVGG